MPKKKKKRGKSGVIRQLENGKYRGFVALGYTGERYIYRQILGSTKEEVQKLIAKEKNRCKNWNISEKSMMPLKEWLAFWLEEIKTPMLGETTYDNYKSFIEKHINPLLGYKKLIYIAREDIIKFIEDLQYGYRSNKKTNKIKYLAYSSISEIYRVLAAAMKSATGAGFIPVNPCRKIKIPTRKKKEVSILVASDINAFLKAIEHDSFWYPLFYLELMTGLRRGELCGLQWSDLNETTKELHIHRSIKYYRGRLIQTDTKTNAGRRTIVLSTSVAKILLARKKVVASNWVFPSASNGEFPINPVNIIPKLKDIFDELNIEYIKFHNLRHTFATQAITNRVEPETLANLMGHADPIYLLNTYTHSTEDLEQGCAKYMDMLLDGVLENTMGE